MLRSGGRPLFVNLSFHTWRSEQKEAQKTYYAKAVVAVHGAVLTVNGKTYSFISWSRDKTKDSAHLSTIVHMFMQDNRELLQDVDTLHIWAGESLLPILCDDMFGATL